MNRTYIYYFANNPIVYSFLNKTTPIYFSNRIHLSDKNEFDIRMTDDQFNYLRQMFEPCIPDGYIEYKGLISLTAKKLLDYNCCIIHSVSFIWKDKAWLLMAESGTGKTTQYLNWNRLFSDKLVMISGDMPVLEYNDDVIIVHSSPWNGKEKIGNYISKELGGIVLLKQYLFNHMEHADLYSSITSLFKYFMVIPDNENQIFKQRSNAGIQICMFHMIKQILF